MIKRLQRGLLPLGIMALISAAVAASPLSNEEIKYLEEKQEITFAFQPAHAPFEFIVKSNRSGMNIELAQWIATELGFKAKFIPASLKKGQEMLLTGEVDALTSIFNTPEREENFAVTAHAMKDDREKCLHSGMNDYLSKPVSRKQLAAIINQYCT